MDISLLSSLTAIHYDEGNLAFLKASLLHFDCGIQLQCISGEGILSTGAQQFHLHKMSELIFWEGSIMQLIEASDDFHVRFLLYPKKLFLQAAISLDTTYFNYMREFPQYNHEEESWKNISLWMNMGQLPFYPASFCIQRTAGTEFPTKYADVDFSVPSPDTYVSVAESYTRKQLLFHKFMHLIHEHAAQMHQVSFYAGKLCISPRYLHEITEAYSNGKTPKALIDEQLTAELKVLLNNPALSIAEIASLCQFPDSSYLSRFFKKNTGISPKEYRTQKQPK